MRLATPPLPHVLRVLASASYLALASTLLAACNRVEPPPEPEPWNVRASVLEPGEGDAPVACALDADTCRCLPDDSLLPTPIRLQTRAAKVTLHPADGTSIDLAPFTNASLNPVGDRTVELSAGSLTLRHEPAEGATAASPRLLVHGRTLAMGPGPGTVSVRAEKEGFALTVQRGRVSLGGEDGGRDVVAGRTVWVPKQGKADTRAEFSGEVAPVAPVHSPKSVSPAHQRGLGRMTARVPGTEAVVDGVRLLSHEARVVVRDGFARTEIIEEFRNDTDRVLEGRYVFRLPAHASISRLALWVGDKLVEGEVVEKDRAARIFKGIVDDTVRPRDPALLEWVSGAEFSLKVFPIPPKKSRRVLLAYNEVLSTEAPRVSYVHPLFLGDQRATPMGRFRIQVDVYSNPSTILTPLHDASVKEEDSRSIVTFEATEFLPRHDFVVTFAKTAAPLAVHVPGQGNAGFSIPEASLGAEEGPTFALRVRASLPDGMALPEVPAHRRVIVLDRSASQTKETFDAQRRLALGLLQRMGSDESFALLACDSDCDAYPDTGLHEVTAKSIDDARTWLDTVQPGGATDLSQSLLIGLDRFEGSANGQLVYVGDGSVSAGDLDASRISERISGSLQTKGIELRFIGAGVSVDEVLLGNVARTVGATFETLESSEGLDTRVETVAAHLRTPVLSAAKLELPEGFFDVHPLVLPNLRLGEEMVVTGRFHDSAGGTARLVGRLGNAPYALPMDLTPGDGSGSSNPLVPRLWAEARIATLEAVGDKDSRQEIVRLSAHHHVMSRHTAMLVLENERMYAEFGIARTQPTNAPALRPSGATGDGDDGAKTDIWGEADASSGLGLDGIGEGGGGRGEGIGFGAGARKGTSGHSSAPRIRMGSTSVSGRLPPEVIQRIVRTRYGRFRACYEGGLSKDPELQGRVVVRFLIDSNGRVPHATNAGSTLPDTAVVQCVVQSFRSLSFPPPDGGTVTVVYPIQLSAGAPLPDLRAYQPTKRVTPVVHRPQDDRWRDGSTSKTGKSKFLETLREDLKKDERSRRAHTRFVRGLLQRGRFEEALSAARHFATLDPDLPTAHELLAQAEAASGNATGAVAEVAWLAEAQPRSMRTQRRAAQAYEALGEERRACSHWNATYQLEPKDDRLRYEAIRCTARARGQRGQALTMARAVEKPDKDLVALTGLLENDEEVPAYDPSSGRAGAFEASVSCEDAKDECPHLFVLAPNGTVLSPWTPSSSRSGARFVSFHPGDGSYRAIVVGGSAHARGKLEVRARGVARTFEVQGGTTRTVGATDIHTPRLAGW